MGLQGLLPRRPADLLASLPHWLILSVPHPFGVGESSPTGAYSPVRWLPSSVSLSRNIWLMMKPKAHISVHMGDSKATNTDWTVSMIFFHVVEVHINGQIHVCEKSISKSDSTFEKVFVFSTSRHDSLYKSNEVENTQLSLTSRSFQWHAACRAWH